MQHKISIEPDGRVRFLYHDDLRGLMEEGAAAVCRASHVEPVASGGWSADLSPVGGPTLGPFETRAEALAAEVRWIEETIL